MPSSIRIRSPESGNCSRVRSCVRIRSRSENFSRFFLGFFVKEYLIHHSRESSPSLPLLTYSSVSRRSAISSCVRALSCRISRMRSSLVSTLCNISPFIAVPVNYCFTGNYISSLAGPVLRTMFMRVSKASSVQHKVRDCSTTISSMPFPCKIKLHCPTPPTLPTPSATRFSVVKPHEKPAQKERGLEGVAPLFVGGG